LRVEVVDVSDPAHMRQVGATAPFPHFVQGVAVDPARPYACVAAGGAGLRVVDISDPTHPFEAGAWDSPGYAEGVAVSGTVAYLADGPYGLRVVDVSDPAHPTPMASAYDVSYAFGVAISGHYAYIASAGAGLLIADLSDPLHPVPAGALDTPGYAYAVAVAGGTAYVADAWAGLRVVDVSDPAHPAEMGACDTPGWALGVAALDGRAFVADGAGGLRVIDVSDRSRPMESGAYAQASLARAVAISGSVAYLADQGQGLRAIDVSVAAHPTSAGLYSPLIEAQQVAVSGTVACVAAGFQGLRVVDASDPAHPRQVGAYDCGGAYAVSVAVSGTIAYVATSMLDQVALHVVDVSDPAHPLRLAAFAEPPDWGPFRGIALDGDTVYVADEAGIGLIDVHNPAGPVALGHLWLDLERYMATVAVAAQGTVAYVAHAAYGLKIVDVSNPLSPTLLSAFMPPHGCSAVGVAGNRVYALDGNGLQIVDVTDPRHPAGMGKLDTPGYASAVTVAGDRAFVCDGGGGVLAVDVSDPWSPTVVASYDTPGYAYHATLGGANVYVADGGGGLVILEQSGQASLASPNRGNLGPLGQPAPPRTRDGVPNPEQGTPSLLDGFAQGPSSVWVHGGWRFAAIEEWQKHLSERSGHIGAVGSATGGGAAVPGGSSTSASTRVVTTTADSGPGSLRWWLERAVSGDTVTFDTSVFPPARPATITLESTLPPVAQGHLTIDASNAGVVLDGRLLAEGGLWLGSDDNVVMGLQMVNFEVVALSSTGRRNRIGGDRDVGSGPTGQGNLFSAGGMGLNVGGGAQDNIVEGNLVGTDPSGRVAWHNWEGIGINGLATHNTVGGPTAGRRNIISGNQTGVILLGDGTDGNVIAGNYIGTDITGRVALGNDWGVGIYWRAAGNVVGGVSPAERNLISGNHEHGIVIADPGTTHNAVLSNWIGSDATGTLSLGYQAGIGIYTCGFNRIGGTEPGEGNVFSGNEGASAIDTAGFEASDNIILGNVFGLAAGGTVALGNGIGVGLGASARHCFIGGASAAEANVISNNDIGVELRQAGTDYNFILGNRIGVGASVDQPMGNHEDGIWIADYAAHNWVQGNVIAYNAAHRPADRAGVRVMRSSVNTLRRNAIYSNAGLGILLTDGANAGLSSPVVAWATPSGAAGGACPGCLVEVFSDDQDEGRVYEGSTVADAEGHFTFTKATGLTGPYLTATATDGDGNTSEFSLPVPFHRLWLPLILRTSWMEEAER
jgi:hypothetical protein